ncbi:MAG: hypothetical protein ACOCZ8_03620, partial [Bacteroidota bacterium]
FTLLPMGIDIDQGIGRLDFISSKGIKTLFILEEASKDHQSTSSVDYQWSILYNDGQRLELSQENFEQMLKEMIEYAPGSRS